MPRDARVVCSGVPYHVTQRGNYRQDIKTGDRRNLFLYLCKIK